jgi:hypothetical protein
MQGDPHGALPRPLDLESYQKRLETKSRPELLAILHSLGGVADRATPRKEILWRIANKLHKEKTHQDKKTEQTNLWQMFASIVPGALIVFAVSAFLIFDVTLPAATRYCRRENISGSACRPCPASASCSTGEVYCHPGFANFENLCVRDDNRTFVIGRILSRIVRALERQAGDYLCWFCERDWLSLGEIEEIAVRAARVTLTGREAMDLLPEVVEYLRGTSSGFEILPFNRTQLFVAMYPKKPSNCRVSLALEVGAAFGGLWFLCGACFARLFPEAWKRFMRPTQNQEHEV